MLVIYFKLLNFRIWVCYLDVNFIGVMIYGSKFSIVSLFTLAFIFEIDAAVIPKSLCTFFC